MTVVRQPCGWRSYTGSIIVCHSYFRITSQPLVLRAACHCSCLTYSCVFDTLQEIDHTYKRRRFQHQNTIKHNCPARIYIREITRYPQFAVRCPVLLHSSKIVLLTVTQVRENFAMKILCASRHTHTLVKELLYYTLQRTFVL